MEMIADVTLQEGMAFEVGLNGHKFMIDAGEQSGGKNLGPRPKALTLASLGGCTGIDVISILRKMRIEPDYFNVTVGAELTEEHPKYLSKIHSIYSFKGKILPMNKLEKAINLSQEHYCGVSLMLGKTAVITHEIKILE